MSKIRLRHYIQRSKAHEKLIFKVFMAELSEAAKSERKTKQKEDVRFSRRPWLYGFLLASDNSATIQPGAAALPIENILRYENTKILRDFNTFEVFSGNFLACNDFDLIFQRFSALSLFKF